ncbi:MAG: spike base protein, RCAP_Rcc01079 family [Pikeienuella sp.]
MADFYANVSGGVETFGRKGRAITPNDGADLADVAKGVVVTSIAGGTTLRILPVENADGEWVDFAGVQVGFIPPYQVRRVGAATNCSVASVLDERAT